MTSSMKRHEQARSLGERLMMTIEFIERVQDFPSGAQLREIVRAEMERGRLSALRILERDVNEMSLTLAPHERDGLEALLKQRVGFDAEASWLAERAAAKRSLAAGRVRSAKERQRLERYLEALVVRGDDAEEVAAIEALLTGA